MVSRRDQPTTVISGVPVFILCSASISSVIVKERCFALVMSTVLIGGKRFWNRLSRDTRKRRTGNTFGVMLHFLSLSFITIWSKTAFYTPSDYLQTKYFMIRLGTC